MTSRDFVYWLQGFFEITDANHGNHSRSYKLDEAQVDMIKRHLALVFKHEIDPSMGNEKHQQELNEIHEGDSKPPEVHHHHHSSPPMYRC